MKQLSFILFQNTKKLSRDFAHSTISNPLVFSPLAYKPRDLEEQTIKNLIKTLYVYKQSVTYLVYLDTTVLDSSPQSSLYHSKSILDHTGL